MSRCELPAVKRRRVELEKEQDEIEDDEGVRRIQLISFVESDDEGERCENREDDSPDHSSDSDDSDSVEIISESSTASCSTSSSLFNWRGSKQLTLRPSTKNRRSKQARSFHPSWLKGRTHWLVYREGEGMFCLLCKKYDKRPFNRDTWNDKPCTRIRQHSILTHESSAAHRDAVKLELAASSSTSIVGALNPPVSAVGISLFVLFSYTPYCSHYKL